MSIPINSVCIDCHLRRRLSLARQLGTEEQAAHLEKKILQVIHDAPPEMDSTWLASITEPFLQQLYGLEPDRMKAEKEASNQFVLDRLHTIRGRVLAAPDPIYAALQFAILGNYLDFSALRGEVSFDALDSMLDKASAVSVDPECYQHFLQDLHQGTSLLYLTDNAGEIVFDRLLAELLQEKYPHLQITFCVRGGAVANDATREDARAVGISFPVIDNGNAIGGTVLRFAGQELRSAIEEADVILSKGMGNIESLFGCGYNVYYAFLVKCERFIQFFNKPKMTPMFLREKA